MDSRNGMLENNLRSGASDKLHRIVIEPLDPAQ
jgi:hypothetical protein